MKKASFLVAFLAVVQVTFGQQIALGQQRGQDRRTVEEALDLAGEGLGEELEALARQLEFTAERMGEQLENWAEENADQLEAWSEKYSGQWESWGARFEQKIERLAEEQEGIWGKWAQRYERDLEKLADRMESDEFEPKHFGEFVERNLDMLSQMPLGQLVDQALEEGVGELGDAPWKSLEELGELAKDAIEEPLNELAEVFEEGSDERRAFQHSARELGRAVERLHDDVIRNIADDDQSEFTDDDQLDPNPRIRALEALRDRNELSEAQIQRIEDMIRTIRDADHLRNDVVKDSLRDDRRDRARVDVPHRDQIMEKIRREQQRHHETLRQFNDDLRRSSEESRKAEMRARELDSRTPKRADGKNTDNNPKAMPNSQPGRKPRVKLGGRETKKPPATANRNQDSNKAGDAEKNSDLDMLRHEIAKLRKEVEQLKKKSDK